MLEDEKRVGLDEEEEMMMAGSEVEGGIFYKAKKFVPIFFSSSSFKSSSYCSRLDIPSVKLRLCPFLSSTA